MTQRIGRVAPTGALDPTWTQKLRQAAQTGPARPTLSSDQATISLQALGPRRRSPTMPLGLDRPAAPTPVRLDVASALLRVAPLASNRAITSSYGDIHQQFRGYLGANAMSDWSALAENASGEAGTAIHQARTIRQALQTFVDGRIGGEARAMSVLAGMLEQEDAVSQGARLMLASLGVDLAAVAGIAGTVMFSERSFLEDGFRKTVTPLLESLQKVERQLTVGNRAIYANIAPAYAVFLEAETSGRDGVAALMASDYRHAPLLVEAFQHFQMARSAGDRQSARVLIQQGNELIARHEQEIILQPVLEPIRMELRQVSATMSYQPPGATQRLRLLPEGGDWGNVKTRLQAIAGVSRAFLDHDMTQAHPGHRGIR